MKPNNKIYITVIIFGLIALALIIFLIYPLFKEIKKNSQELTTLKKELILLKSQIGELENFGEIYQNYQPNLTKINQLFVDPKGPVEFIQFLEKTAADLEILIEISPLVYFQKENETKSWNFFSFQISSKGSFSNFLKFSEKLEASPYLIEIENLTLKRLSEKELEREQQYFLGTIEATYLIKVFTNL